MKFDTEIVFKMAKKIGYGGKPEIAAHFVPEVELILTKTMQIISKSNDNVP